MFLTALLFVLVGAGICLVAPTVRAGWLIALGGAAASWVAISRYAYLSPIEVNEPEWWGGLAILLSLAAIGVTLGVVIRSRQDGSPGRNRPMRINTSA